MDKYIILTGTDPKTSSGGIGVVMNGYIDALKNAVVPHECLPTYAPSTFWGRHILWLTVLPSLMAAILKMKKAGKEVVVYSHVGSGGSLFREFFIQLIAWLFRARTVHHSHAPQMEHYVQNGFVRQFIRLVFWPSEKVVVLTDYWKRFFQSNGFKNDFYVVHNPLPPELQAATQVERKHENKSEIKVLAIARLARGKGVDMVIRAVSKIPDGVKLLVAGDGEMKGELLELTRKVGAKDRVTFLGWVSGKEKEDLFRDVDVFCLPSTNDAYPMSFVESMSYGIPVVGVEYAGIPDIVESGKHGFLTDVGDVDALAEALVKLKEAKLRNEMGRAAQAHIAGISSPGKVAEDILGMLK